MIAIHIHCKNHQRVIDEAELYDLADKKIAAQLIHHTLNNPADQIRFNLEEQPNLQFNVKTIMRVHLPRAHTLEAEVTDANLQGALSNTIDILERQLESLRQQKKRFDKDKIGNP